MGSYRGGGRGRTSQSKSLHVWVLTLSKGRMSLTKIPRFCQQDEENDPSEEFELYLACGVCGDNGLLISIMCD